ncbi:NCS1 family nucleobase:cation symporter-1 [Carnimonas nigrificans]|uniref:NCS1 family nucleobase:cation symporter-1 n=1 Tax=Carnimonas nigrificans TaxID=64323 RepID=UPI000471A1BF|nr:NCS1 family nucleobase:cation symporter-1 [Carnimonas nigrificans]
MQDAQRNGPQAPVSEMAAPGAMAAATSPVPTGYSRRLYNRDLAPTQQRWGAYNIVAFWMSDVHSVGGYVVAASLFSLGLAGWQVLLALVVGIFIVQYFANLMAVPSQQAAVPFPVICRISFGVLGANIPALIRGVIALVWFGIQTFLASSALTVVLLRAFPSMQELTYSSWLGLSALGWLSFLLLWSFQAMVFWKGMEGIRRFIDWSGPLVYVAMFALAAWLFVQAGPSRISFTLNDQSLSVGQQYWQILVAIALVVGYFAAPALSFGDFGRYCRSKEALKRGNFWGLPVNFIVFAVTSVMMVSATLPVFGEMVSDPIETVSRLDNTYVALLGALTFVTTTMGINIVANFVSPAFDFSNVAPRLISFKTGGFIAAIGSVFLMPWKLFSSPELIQDTVGVLAAVIGPIYGIILSDFYRIKRGKIHIDSLYQMGEKGHYWYRNGINPCALIALVPSALISLIFTFMPGVPHLNDFSIFAGALVAAGSYLLLSRTSLASCRGSDA